MGRVEAVPPRGEAEAAALMFARHPHMRAWARLAHEWRFYELHVAHVEILDFFGGFHNVSRDAYFAAAPAPPPYRAALAGAAD